MPSCAALFANSSNVMVGNLIKYMALPSMALLLAGVISVSRRTHSACAHANAASNKLISLQFNVSLANTDSRVDTSMSTNPSDVRAISAYKKNNLNEIVIQIKLQYNLFNSLFTFSIVNKNFTKFINYFSRHHNMLHIIHANNTSTQNVLQLIYINTIFFNVQCIRSIVLTE